MGLFTRALVAACFVCALFMTYSIFRQASSAHGRPAHRGAFHDPPATLPSETESSLAADVALAQKLVAEALAWGKAMQAERDAALAKLSEAQSADEAEEEDRQRLFRDEATKSRRVVKPAREPPKQEPPVAPLVPAQPPRERAEDDDEAAVLPDLEAESLARSAEAQTRVETLMELAAEASAANARARAEERVSKQRQQQQQRRGRGHGRGGHTSRGGPREDGPSDGSSAGAPDRETDAAHTKAKTKEEDKDSPPVVVPPKGHHHHHKGGKQRRAFLPHERNLTACYSLDGESQCVSAEIQFRTRTKVHLVPGDSPKSGWRFQHLVTMGFAAHPSIVPTEKMREADLVLYLPVSTRTPPTITDGATPTNLVVLDEGDGAGFYSRVKEHDYLIYLKRSWVTKRDGAFTGSGKRYSRNYYPMAYSMSDSYFDPIATKSGKDRTLDVLCSNRPTDKQPTRARVVKWVKEFLDERPSMKGVAGEVNAAGRREINDAYFSAMRDSKIVVTANPSFWEGDFRFFEAVASGALIFVDEMYVPHPRPFKHGEHVIVFDNSDRDEFHRLLDYYLTHPDEARRIARAGLRHALRYHRAVSRMDYYLRSAHEVAASSQSSSSSPGDTWLAYTHTARQIAFDVNATTQVDPVVDISRPDMNKPDLSPRLNLGRRKRVPPPLTKDENADLVRANRKERQRFLGGGKFSDKKRP